MNIRKSACDYFSIHHFAHCSIDVWSAGTVFAELLLGQPIFPGDSGVDQLVEIIKVKCFEGCFLEDNVELFMHDNVNEFDLWVNGEVLLLRKGRPLAEIWKCTIYYTCFCFRCLERRRVSRFSIWIPTTRSSSSLRLRRIHGLRSVVSSCWVHVSNELIFFRLVFDILKRSPLQVFRPTTPSDAIDLISQVNLCFMFYYFNNFFFYVID